MTRIGHIAAELDVARPDWQADAACRNHPDPDLWFPDWSEFSNSKKPDHLATAADWSPEATAICLGCPAAAPCLDYALRRNLDGIWAATTPRERRRIRRRRGLTLIEHTDPTTQPQPEQDPAA